MQEIRTRHLMSLKLHAEPPQAAPPPLGTRPVPPLER